MDVSKQCSSRWARQTAGASRLFLGMSLAMGLLLGGNALAGTTLDPVLSAALKDTQTPALAMLVIRNDTVERQSVVGVRRNDGTTAAQNDDVWLIGSTGKPMTVALIARLVEQGRLDWNAPLSKMLPDLTSINPAYRSVTLTQLLLHRAGLPENLQDTAALDAFFTDNRSLPVQREAYILKALQKAPVSPPGTEFACSNSGFLIAAVIAERVTGTDFETLMEREVFTPLGMDSAGFGPTAADQPQGHRGGKPVLTHGGSDGNWLAWVALFPESGNGVIAIANAAEDMGADKATMGAMGPILAELAPAAAAK